VYDALVIGGGVLGASAAYHLVRGGLRTLLVDRADTGRATDAGAGIISPETNSRDPDAWYRLARQAADYYPTLVGELAADGETDTGYARCGKLVVAATADEVAPFEQAWRRIAERQGRQGSARPDTVREIGPDEARRRFPPLARVHRAMYTDDAARVDGRLLTGALRRAAERRGLAIRAAGVERLVAEHGAVTGAVVDGEPLAAARTVIAGGAWSAALAAQLGVELPVAPQRGQIIHLDVDADSGGWPAVNGFHGHYIVGWPDRRVVAGATRETGSGFHPEVTAAGVREVLDEALRVAPGLAPARIREIRVGLRPLSADGLPVLGPVDGWRGVVLATGHGPTGLTLGPYSGKLLADLILGRAPAADVAPFALARFAAASRR
jgi:D-amino-acid dehydrogenase